jgi:lipoyl(octanoyl) transferase
VKIKKLGLVDYDPVLRDMQKIIQHGIDYNQFWILQHNQVFTVGVNKKNLVLPNTSIPIIFSDRGGKITYHGPGQVIIYTLIKLKDINLTISKFVRMLENSVIQFLDELNIIAHRIVDAPGVYINGSKIASVGLKVKNSQIYHGLSFNNNMDLKPFNLIDTCGYKNLKVTQLIDHGIDLDNNVVADKIIIIFLKNLKEHETTRN